MPYHFEFDAEHRILLIVLEGRIQRQELEVLNQDIQQRAERVKPSAAIADLSPVMTLNVPAYTMRTAALGPAPFSDETLRLIVAPTDHLFGMARMYEVFANRPVGKLQVVRSRGEALAAIGVENLKFERME